MQDLVENTTDLDLLFGVDDKWKDPSVPGHDEACALISLDGTRYSNCSTVDTGNRLAPHAPESTVFTLDDIPETLTRANLVVHSIYRQPGLDALGAALVFKEVTIHK